MASIYTIISCKAQGQRKKMTEFFKVKTNKIVKKSRTELRKIMAEIITPQRHSHTLTDWSTLPDITYGAVLWKSDNKIIKHFMKRIEVELKKYHLVTVLT